VANAPTARRQKIMSTPPRPSTTTSSIFTTPSPPGPIPCSIPFRLQILSDLHLEGASTPFTFPAHAPNLALLGDVGLSRTPDLFNFIRAQLLRFQKVFYVLGNHEPYHSSWDATYAAFADFSVSLPASSYCSLDISHSNSHPPLYSHIADSSPSSESPSSKKWGEFILLNRTRYDIPNSALTILGCTLFSHLTETAPSHRIRDFKQISSWTPSQHVAAHIQDLHWLNESVASVSDAGRQAVILTHYSPTVADEAKNPRWRTSPTTTTITATKKTHPPISHFECHAQRPNLDSAFASDLTQERCWNDAAVKLWAFGHTHYNVGDNLRTIAGGKLVTNMKGYAGIEMVEGFEPGRVWEV
jgi:hypothetical protein